MNTVLHLAIMASVASFTCGCAGRSRQSAPQFDVTQRVQFYYSLFFDHTDAFTPDMPQADSFRVDPWDAPILNGAEGYFLVSAGDFRMGLSSSGHLVSLYNDSWMYALGQYGNGERDFPTSELLPKEQMDERAMKLIQKVYGEDSIVEMGEPVFTEDASNSVNGLVGKNLPTADYHLKVRRCSGDASSGVGLTLDWMFGTPIDFAEWPNPRAGGSGP